MAILKDLITLIDIVSAVMICCYCMAGFGALFLKKGRMEAQLIVANGAVLSMSVKVIGALLKTLQLQTWNQLGQFAAIFLMRMLIKKAFQKDSEVLRSLSRSYR